MQPFKVGPDYIDPGLHGLVAGSTSRNLDLKMCSPEYVKNLFFRLSCKADISVIEGVMGLFDGGISSSASLAKVLHIPVVLIINSRSMAESAAAVLKGFAEFDNKLYISAVIFNMTGSERHIELIKGALSGNSGIKTVGFIPREETINIPERHLGLHTSEENPITEEMQDRLADIAEKYMDIDFLCKMAFEGFEELPGKEPACIEPKTTIAVAKDRAFCFYYHDNIDILRRQGANIVYFSPLQDEEVPKGVGGLYFGGGYPELYAESLSQNKGMLKSVKEFVDSGGAVYGECGGFMYLTEGLKTMENRYFPMVGVYPVKAEMSKRRVRLGYREIELTEDCVIGKNGDILKGHEFHYSTVSEMPGHVSPVYKSEYPVQGYKIKNCLASYVHLHFGSNERALRCFIEKSGMQ